MSEPNKHTIIFSVAISLALFFVAFTAGYYFLSVLPTHNAALLELEKQKLELEQKKIIAEELAANKEEVVHSEEVSREQTTEKETTEISAIVNTADKKENLDLILIEYKLDMQQTADLQDALLSASLNSPKQLCPSIVANRTTRENIYYLVEDGINAKEAKYRKYANQISYIYNNLNAQWGVLEFVKDQCASAQYSIE